MAYLQAAAAPAEDPNVRPLTDQDLPAVEKLSADIKVWTLMTLGPYEPPREVWMPSVLY